MQSRFSGPTSNESVRPANGLPNFFSVLLFSRTLIHPLVARGRFDSDWVLVRARFVRVRIEWREICAVSKRG